MGYGSLLRYKSFSDQIQAGVYMDLKMLNEAVLRIIAQHVADNRKSKIYMSRLVADCKKKYY